MRSKTYSELRKLHTFEERFAYLKLYGSVGEETFGHDRFINQKFYTSSEWKRVRDIVLVRDQGCDLGIPGYEIFERPYIHHMEPLTPHELIHSPETALDPEYLITVTHETHNAIHYGNSSLLKPNFAERTQGDTTLWRSNLQNGSGYAW